MAPLRGLAGLLFGAATGYAFLVHASWARMGGVPAAVIMNGRPLVGFDTLATIGWAMAILAPAWFWVARPLLHRRLADARGP